MPKTMNSTAQSIFTFQVEDPEQVDDLCDLWQESLVEWDRDRCLVRVESDALAVEQFLMFYQLYAMQEGAGMVICRDLLTTDSAATRFPKSERATIRLIPFAAQ